MTPHKDPPGSQPPAINEQERKAIRRGLVVGGFARRTSSNIDSCGSYTEVWTNGDNTVTVKWAAGTAPVPNSRKRSRP